MTLEYVSVSDVRREIDKDIYKVLKKYEKLGWRLRRQGHKFNFYCPCGVNEVRVDGSPANPGRQAQRIKREIDHCPTRHELDG